MEALLLIIVGMFFGLIGLVYWFWSYEDAGGMMLLGSFLLGVFPGTYYWYWHKKMKLRHEDDPNATMADGAGVIASFPSTSIWPFCLGIGAFFSLLALVFGVWLLFVGVTLIVVALVGVTAESRRGGTV
jgi:hypothetical protein